MTSKPWMPLYIADYLADTAPRGGNLQQTQGRGAAPATPKPSVGSPLISDTAFKLASEIVRLCGHRDDFLPPSWAGAPMHVQSWLNQGWTAEQITTSCLRQLAKRGGASPESIVYFDKGIADFVERPPTASAKTEFGMDESPYISSASSKGAQPSNASEHGDEIRELVSQMLGSMRITEALDPDVTMAGAEKMFALYPIEACREVAAAESVRVREQYGIAQDVWDALPRHSASKTRVNVLTSE